MEPYNEGFLSKVLKRWELKPVSCTRIMAGDSTYNWLVKTKTKKYILRSAGIYEDYINFQILLFDKLRARKFPFLLPRIVKTKKEESYIKLKNDIFFVYIFIEGKDIGKKISVAQSEQVGFVASYYHEIVTKENFHIRCNRTKDITNIDHTMSDLLRVRLEIEKKQQRKQTEESFLNESFKICKALERIKNNYADSYNKLDRIPCYGDWNGTNLIVNSKKNIVGLIDFGGVHMAPRVFDLQNIILHIALNENSFSLVKTRRFLGGYAKNSKITKDELDLIYPTMLADITFTLVWIFMEKFKKEDCRILDWDIIFRMKIIKWLIKNERIFKNTVITAI